MTLAEHIAFGCWQKKLGWKVSAYAARPDWAPLAGTGFRVRPLREMTRKAVDEANALVVYQPVPDTLLEVLPIASSTRTPVIVDIDDPHWEERYGWTKAHRARVVMGMLRRGRSPLPAYRARRSALALPIITASPFVQDRWPGTVIPHVRRKRPLVPLRMDGPLRIGFIGSPRASKGLEELRSAAARVSGVRLCITAPPPADATSNESWVGTTNLEAGRRLLDQCQLSAVLQHESAWTHRQFPVKIVDAMMAGRVVLGTDLPPIRWATGSAAVLVPPGDPDALVEAIIVTRDDREQLCSVADRARTEAEARFTPEKVAPLFAFTVQEAIASYTSAA